jgi:integrase
MVCNETNQKPNMESDSTSISIAMLKDVINGETYHVVATKHGVTRTAVERRIKALARTLSREVGIDGVNEKGLGFADRLRQSKVAILAALDRYTPTAFQKRPAARTLSDEEIELALHRIRTRSPFPHRDMALLYILLISGARPLEIARLEVRDYLNIDGSVREASVMRAEVAVNCKARPLFFASRKAKETIDRYLTERLRRIPGTEQAISYRGFEPNDRLFLSDAGAAFEIVSCAESGQTRFLCRGIHDAYRKIFRRTGLEGVSALNLRRTTAARMLARGAVEEQIGEVLGISELKAVRELLPDLRQPLQSIVQELV